MQYKPYMPHQEALRKMASHLHTQGIMGVGSGRQAHGANFNFTGGIKQVLNQMYVDLNKILIDQITTA